MTITIKIRTANAAFEDNKDAEVGRILRDWIDGFNLYPTITPLHDYNGNTVGSVTVKGK